MSDSDHAVAVTQNSITNSIRHGPQFFTLPPSVVSLVGLGDAIYLTVEHVAGRSVKCTLVSGCSEVLSSQYASVAGIPLALIGAAAYFTVFSLATLAAFGYKGAGKLLTLVVALMFITSLWLIYLQAFVIKAFCQFCLLSALVTFVLTGLVGRDQPGKRAFRSVSTRTMRDCNNNYELIGNLCGVSAFTATP